MMIPKFEPRMEEIEAESTKANREIHQLLKRKHMEIPLTKRIWQTLSHLSFLLALPTISKGWMYLIASTNPPIRTSSYCSRTQEDRTFKACTHLTPKEK